MKLLFLATLLMDSGANPNGGGFTAEEKAELKTAISELENGLKSKNAELIRKELAEQLKTVNEANEKFTKWQSEKDAADQENQKAIDGILTQLKEFNKKGGNMSVAKTFDVVLAEALKEHDISNRLQKMAAKETITLKLEGRVSMDLKAVADMSLGNNLTGDSQATYNNRQAILPAQKTNFRDLIPSVLSDTGLYVTYRETGGEQASASWIQTEANDSNQVDFDFTEVKTVNRVISGYTRFSRQIGRSLPWLQTTLPRLLMRDFYKKENRAFYDAIATAATGSSTTTETDDVKQIIDWIANQNQNDFNASYGVLSFKAMANLNKLLYTNGYYQGSGGVLSLPNGTAIIGGVPIVPVSWIPSNDKIFIFDQDYMERVEVEGLTVQFSTEDANNFTKHLTTARVSCFEELNTMLPASIIVGDFGNSASS